MKYAVYLVYCHSPSPRLTNCTTFHITSKSPAAEVECGAQQESTTAATYLTAMKPATVGNTTQHYREAKKIELGLLYLSALPKNVLKRQSGEIFEVKKPALSTRWAVHRVTWCVVNWERVAS